MIIFAVDDEKRVLNRLIKAIETAEPCAEVYSFTDEYNALEQAEITPPDVAFIDIRLWNMTGLELAERLKKISPALNVIFTTGYDEYAVDAFRLRVSGYLIKPVSADMIRNELDLLRYPVAEEKELLQINTFGNFEVFFHGSPICFKYAKSKELLAYLIDRKGSLCTTRQLIDILWEDSDNDKNSYFQNVRRDLIETLHNTGCKEALNIKKGNLGIITTAVKCDFYDYINNKLHNFSGEYMSQYTWAEYTLGLLCRESYQ